MIDWLIDPLTFEFMQRAMLVAVVVGIACAVLSCWLTLLGWSLMGDAVSHAVLPGVVLSYVIGAPFAAGAFIFGAGAVGLIGGLNRTSRVKEDAAIGIVFTGLFALGLVLVSVIPSQVDLFHILFGNVLGVSDGDILQVLVLGVLVVVVLLLLRKSLVLYAFDPVHAHAIGISPRRLEMVLLGALALTVIVALQAVGIVLVVAMLITPGATAYLLTDRFDRLLMLAIGTGVLSTVLGTYLSYHLDASTGGMIVVVLTVLFGLAYLFGPRGVLALRRG
ncbi:metal ABC transporter permease [Solirubrobacter sp. CPCC 204708]|uniref:Metal ABC transporter permease n=1 Tax=Solirubrobacter deserti TaxID=2282478 RepID=A0ABT4RMQ8_9ACTN|nr:metal ABC transporter permease [Solirubrobacter deserti]MBE2320125.1 metal ABC transporter permease [Solirubrobacter deserti]MDA0139845.1 metal ABC transporter permease [Solirubrobacter deserti]